MQKILSLFQIETTDRSKLMPLFCFSFFTGIFISIFFSISNSEFINAYGKEVLPIGYLVSGIVGYISVLGYSKIIKKAPGYISFIWGLGFLLTVTVLLLICLFIFNGKELHILRFVIF